MTLIPMIMTVSIPFVIHELSLLIFENLSVKGSLRNYKTTRKLEQKPAEPFDLSPIMHDVF